MTSIPTSVPNLDNPKILCRAILNNDLKKVRTILKSGVDLNVADYSGGPPLHVAVICSNYEAMELLLEHGINVNSRNYSRETPLHIAAEKPHFLKGLELLLKHKADPNARDRVQRTPLHTAVQYCPDLVQMLLQHGADVNAVDGNFQTPLHTATKSCNVDVLELLLNHRVNINAIDSFNLTTLHLTIFSRDCTPNHVSFIKKLLHRGAKVDPKIKQYHCTPLYIAVRLGFSESVDLLLTHGADLQSMYENDRSLSNLRWSEKLLKVIAEHFVKRAVAGFGVETFHEKFIKKIYWDVEAYRQQCISEISKMKELTMCADLTYYNFLHSSRRSLVRIVKTPEIILIFENKSLSTCFPIYVNFLERNYAIGKLYESVLESAMVALTDICKHRLPSVPLEQILGYLDHSDMKNVIEVLPKLPNIADCVIDE